VTRLVRSELLKQRTTRTSGLLLLWMTALVALVVLLHVLSLSIDHLRTAGGQLKVVGWGTSIGALFASLLGATSLTAEIRHGTIRPTFLATPRRQRVIGAKLIAGALIGVFVGLLAEGLTAAIEAAGLAARGIHIELTPGNYAQLLAGGAASGALFAAIGLGVGAIVRQQVGAVVGLCVWLLLVETTLIGNIPAAGKYAPGAAAGAIAGAVQTQSPANLLAPALGVLVLCAYTALAAITGTLLTTRRDVV
jgi:ABC-2 type transport system permease protein